MRLSVRCKLEEIDIGVFKKILYYQESSTFLFLTFLKLQYYSSKREDL